MITLYTNTLVCFLAFDTILVLLTLWLIYKSEFTGEGSKINAFIKGILVLFFIYPLIGGRILLPKFLLLAIFTAYIFLIRFFVKHYFWAFYTMISILLFVLCVFYSLVLQEVSTIPIIGGLFLLLSLPLLFLAPSFCITDISIYIKMRRKQKLFKNSQNNKNKKEIEIYPQESSKITPLLNAIIDNDVSQVTKIIKTDPNQINIIYTENGNTPLHVAAFNGYAEIVQLLLEQPNIDTTVLNKEHKTAFDIAEEKGYIDISALLR